jgi:mannosyltransferase OCH1-like enzyme
MRHIILFCILASAMCIAVALQLDYSSEYFTLPLLPTNFESLATELYGNCSRPTDKKIPRNFWLSFREVPADDKIPHHLVEILARTRLDGWGINMVDNYAKDQFMEKYFPNTSILHAYHNIHPHAKVAASDIWRYAALYLFGGVYMDDDSSLSMPFEKMIEAEDTFIVSHESNRFKDDCYVPQYNLSNYYNHNTYNTTIFHQYLGDRTLVTWLMMIAPRHPLMLQVLRYIVDVHHHEYSRMKAIKLHRFDARWKSVMCGTGPPLVTATIRAEMLKRDLGLPEHFNFTIKLMRKDFMDYGGIFKVDFTQNFVNGESSHYMVYMNKHNIPLLASYKRLTIADIEGVPITDPTQKHLYLVQNGSLHPFPNYDTFMAMGFHLRYVVHLADDEFAALAVGDKLPELNYDGPVM